MVPVKTVLDTDIGTDVDDALALALALNSPEIELLAVTVVSTEVNLRSRLAANMTTRPIPHILDIFFFIDFKFSS